jgi:hypothetical protein
MKIQLGDEIILEGKEYKVVSESGDGEVRLDSGDGKYLIRQSSDLEFVGRAEFKIR